MKAETLRLLENEGYPVPPFCVVDACWMDKHFSRCEHAGRADCSRLPPGLDVWLAKHLPEAERFAVRSSASVEDGSELSFAGMFSTRLDVPKCALAKAIRDVWASATSHRVSSYCRDESVAPAMNVMVQQMIEPDVSGVAFAVDPVSGRRDVAVVSAVRGRGEHLVSGIVNADRFEVDTDGAITAEPAGADAVLGNFQVRTIALLARTLSSRFGKWQDIEWCIADGKLWLLQSRPITGLAQTPDAGGRMTLWDNSNIVESYSGVTTPLTFSFVRHVYAAVYPQFCRFMGVEPSLIDANKELFEMLGLIEGRIYYNLLNWYRALGLLPGYAINSRFMEQMMGVSEELTVPPPAVAPTRNRWLRLARSVAGMTRAWFTLKRDTREFHALVDNTLSGFSTESLAALDLHELVDRYFELERRLLSQWRAPLVNDFFAMACFGLLRKSLAAWCPSLTGEASNALLAGQGTIISTEPIRRLYDLVDQCRQNESLVALAGTADAATFHRALMAQRELLSGFEALRGRFGARTLGELKLETVTAAEDPILLAAQVQAYLVHGMPEQCEGAAAAIRVQAEGRLDDALAGHFVRRTLVHFLLRHTSRLVSERENLRFERTRVFSAARKLFLAFGERLAKDNVLDDSRDVFWLTKEEIFDFVRGTGVDTQPRSVAQRRKAEWDVYRERETADRFETFGAPYVGNSFTTTDSPLSAGAVLSGTGCCAGRVTGEAMVVTDPSDVVDLAGKILVAEHTDPGWTPLFPLARGILVERGSLLSHSAIVARELGVPAIVAIPNLLQRIKSGDVVSFDGGSGEISFVPGEVS